MRFCSKHRLPENHECPFDLKKSSEFEESLNRWDILYQDALDFMSQELTVAKIYEYVTTKHMNDEEAIELLNYILESSEDIEIQKISVLAFKVLKLKDEKVFIALENFILSEEDPSLRKTAVDVIKHLFPKKSKDLIRWVNTHNNNFPE
ncbi:hypothetical protein LCGC14_0835210 [marine sediment metagenome]|uniref:AN1-type domain-containing protein n=1 Tax=marine sediment metagenome TaxID=412755 RepID=A0A0F9RZI8_9ZZZZ